MNDQAPKSAKHRKLVPVPAPWCPQCWASYDRNPCLCSTCGYDARREVVLISRGPTIVGRFVGIPVLVLILAGCLAGIVWSLRSIPSEGFSMVCSSLFLLAVAYLSGVGVLGMIMDLRPHRRSAWRFREDGICSRAGGNWSDWHPWPRHAAIRVSFGQRDFECRRQIQVIVYPSLRGAWSLEDDEPEIDPSGPVLNLRQSFATLRNLLIVGQWLEAARHPDETSDRELVRPTLAIEEPDERLYRPPSCPACGYLLRGLARPLRCPECGWTTQRPGQEEAIVLAGWAGESWSRHEAGARTRAGVFVSKAKETSFFLGCAIFVLAIMFGGGLISRFVPPIVWQLGVGLVVVLVLTGVVGAVLAAWLRKADPAADEAQKQEQATKAAWAAAAEESASHTFLHLAPEGFLQSSGPTQLPLRPWSDATGWRVRSWFGALRITAERLGVNAKLTGGRERSEARPRPVDLVCELPRELAPVLRRRIARWRNVPVRAEDVPVAGA